MTEAPDVTRPHRFSVQSSHAPTQALTSQPVKERPLLADAGTAYAVLCPFPMSPFIAAPIASSSFAVAGPPGERVRS